MDFTPTEEQTAVRELAARIFTDLSTHERLGAAGGGTDAELWKALCAAGLPGAVEETGLLGLVLLLEEQGRVTAQVPLAAGCAYGILAVSRHGTDEQRGRLLPGLRDGTTVVTGAFPATGTGTGTGTVTSRDGRLSGAVEWVPWLRDATHVLVPDEERTLWLVRTEDAARIDPVELTAPWSAGRLVLDGTPGERLGGPGGDPNPDTYPHTKPRPDTNPRSNPDPHPHPHPDPYADVLAAARIAFAGLQAGVCAGSLARAVEYTSVREQFGRPLSTHQAVQLRAADAYMDTEAIRVTAYEAAWRFDEGLDVGEAALTTAWWASEAGKRVVHAGQHLHGGMGADLDHPVHRHFLWGRQLDAYLGCGTELLAELGDLLAEGDAS
ncbi:MULTISPECIES: acyl-CoA dehydrogenase family protein [unclassified Streptomyces]|uniref:acyl-CoA dehydrogenase family protein n=1 Tax=unclassified Streptomyces TaxID=2593676 RepID=UPI0006F3E29C|nr:MULTISPECIES: acyl-CoA dehydrogenase family protein [unclassified Streptomyces]KQX49386.1 acyl-CoA dehydrogenase [Streptomyces sp. Root1304]KRA79004.1 acyl-CoA dehydrogenase [Streptomyces sp. Root66D1]